MIYDAWQQFSAVDWFKDLKKKFRGVGGKDIFAVNVSRYVYIIKKCLGNNLCKKDWSSTLGFCA